MKKFLFLKEGSADSLRMWIRSCDFWDISYEIVDFTTFQQLELKSYELVALIDQMEIPEQSRSKLDGYVRSGGKLLISGNLSGSLAPYFGDIRVHPIQRDNIHRCIRMKGNNRIGSWNDGEILFFTNTYNCSGKDYAVETGDGLAADLILASLEATVIDQDLEQWGEWRQSEEPSLISRDIGDGKVVYIPLCLGEMEWVVQPRVPTFTEYSYVVGNHGVMLFIRDIFCYLAGPDTFACRPLWPGGAKCCVVLSGDVHDYEGIPGRADREYRDMIDNADILKEYGIDGKATFFLTGAVARKFPEEIRQAISRGYEICPHTHQDTCYSIAGWDYLKQKNDIIRCVESFRGVAPEIDDYAKGFRTHGYNSNYDTRLALENLGYEYIADLQGWEMTGKYNTEYPEGLVTYVALPQHATDYRGRKLKLLEIPDTAANDHFVYRIKKMSPEQALEFFKDDFDRMYRLGGLYQTCLHPYVSTKEEPGREHTYRELINHIASKENVVFMRMKELTAWWKEREAR